MSDASAMRRDYQGDALSPKSAPDSPFELFDQWFESASQHEGNDANSMTLATVDSAGLPHARIVLLKGFDDQGFNFFTNYHSHKGNELSHVPHAALVFWWPKLQRQVRIEGSVERVSAEASETYFASRPRGSQIGAWASQQSVEIPDRTWLEERTERFETLYTERDVERPAHWGGYLLCPNMIEFWQGQASRLHDRVRYQRYSDSDKWRRSRLSP